MEKLSDIVQDVQSPEITREPMTMTTWAPSYERVPNSHIPAVSRTIHVENGRATAWTGGFETL
jgi:hypothetical protein